MPLLRRCAKALITQSMVPINGAARNVTKQIFHASKYKGHCNKTQYKSPNVKQLPVHVRERMHETEDRNGFIPNFLQVYARRPREFKAFYEYYDALIHKEEGNLTRADREMVALVTSSKLKCLYCVVAHSGQHRKYSNKPELTEQLIANWEHADLTSREKAILSLASTVCHSQEVTDEYFKNLEDHGLNKEDAWDIAALVAFTTMTAQMLSFIHVQPNREFYKMGRNGR
uniref:uncharacterized protein LOC120339374 n=1 Tax=Styela clava TaxID=7725 RepID=UPI00193A3E7F|nr:uncharacterized protein LOC120339374 [Styela clava]